MWIQMIVKVSNMEVGSLKGMTLNDGYEALVLAASDAAAMNFQSNLEAGTSTVWICWAVEGWSMMKDVCVSGMRLSG